MNHTFPLSGPINLSARLGHGSLAVRAVDGVTEAVVELDGGEGALTRMTVELDGPTLTVHGPRQGGLADLFALGRGHKSESIHATITVPTGTAMRVATFTAPVTVDGRCGGADIASGAGDITLAEVDGDLTLRFGSAAATVGRVTGSVTVHSGSGSAKFGEILGNLEAGCARGTLSVDTVRGRSRSRSGAGEAAFGAVYGDVDLASGSGAMRIGLPAGVTARLDVMTGAGQVRSELPVTDEPAQRGGAITVRARTGNGDIRVVRAA